MTVLLDPFPLFSSKPPPSPSLSKMSTSKGPDRCTDRLQKKAEENLPFPSFRAHPLTLLRWELKLVCSKLLLFPFLFLPLQSPWKEEDRPSDGISTKLGSSIRVAWAGFEQTYLFLASVLSIVGTTALLFVFGAWGVGALAISIWFLWAQKRYLQYGTIKRVEYGKERDEKEERPDEEWVRPAFSFLLDSPLLQKLKLP